MITIEEKEDEKKRKTAGYIAAGVFHILLFIAFFMVSWTEPDPLPLLEEPDPVIMDFSGGGGGSPSEATASIPTPIENTNVVTDEHSNIVTHDGSNTVVKPSEPKPNPLAAFGGMSGNGNDGDGDGNGTGDGNGDGLNGTGNGLYGNGSFGGRKLENKPELGNIPEARGVVVMNVWVNQDGFITRYNYNSAKSTTNNPDLIAVCESALKRMKSEKRLVNADPKAPFEQSGTYKFEFSLR